MTLLPIGLGLAGAAVLGFVAWLAVQPPIKPPAPAPQSIAALPPAPTAPPTPAATPLAQSPPPQTAPSPAAPSFDIVRVSPQGDAVIAGRAAPGADVTLHENGTTIGTAKADAQGQFVIVPPKPIAPGAGELSLTARTGTGPVTQGAAPVVVLIQPTQAPATTATPSTPTAPPAPVVLLTSPTEPPRFLQPPPAPPGPAARITLDVVDYDAAGHIRFAGRGPPDAAVRLYVDNTPIGDAHADAKGNWALSPPREVAVGNHALRLDLLANAAGKVQARVELPFRRAAIPTEAQPERIVVQPRQNLWRIARSTYGQGVRYTEIFAANRDQIRDPNLIFPGQIFTVPGATPASASTSR